jgi:glycosyltransferase involved in cell wall biosynthesis
MLSIVIPCLNEADFIDGTLKSLIDSESPGIEWEAIVVDGGSDDGTRDRLKHWVDQEPRIRWLDNPARVTPVAMNLGIEAAQGEWVLILGAHSEVAPDFLKRNAEAMRAHPESACVGGVWNKFTAHGQRGELAQL